MNELGAITVLLATNLLSVAFKPVYCPHPGCNDAHSYNAIENYAIVRSTYAETSGTNKLLSVTTNYWKSITNHVSHPAVWKRRENRRVESPPLPPVIKSVMAYGRRGTIPTPVIATPVQDTNQYGVLYNVTSNYPTHRLVLERRGADRISGVEVYPGEVIERFTNPPVHIAPSRGPTTNPLPNSKRFIP